MPSLAIDRHAILPSVFRRAGPQSVDVIRPLRAKPFHRDGWVYEETYDGWRIVAFKEGHRVRLVARDQRTQRAD